MFTLEALCARARPALKGAKLILDVSTESSLTTAARTQNRHELLDARRTGSLPTDTPLRIVLKSTETGAQRRTADVLYKDDRVLFPSPRPRQLFRAASTDPGDRDVERSRASLEAYERERAANLALGCIIVDADSRAGDHAGDITKRAFFRTAVQSSSEDSEAADEATAAALVEAMGGAQIIPRRLVLAAGRVHDHPVSSEYGSRLHLERAFQYSMDKSEVLDSLDVARRLSWFAVKALLHGGRKTLVEAVFREKVCEAAGLSATDSAVVWREAMGGAVPPFTPSYVDPLTHERREVGDVRPGDVAVLKSLVGCGPPSPRLRWPRRRRAIPPSASRPTSVRCRGENVRGHCDPARDYWLQRKRLRVVHAAGGPRRPRVPARRRDGRRAGPSAGRCGGREPVDAGARYDACRRRPSRVRRGRFDDSAEQPGRLGHR